MGRYRLRVSPSVNLLVVVLDFALGHGFVRNVGNGQHLIFPFFSHLLLLFLQFLDLLRQVLHVPDFCEEFGRALGEFSRFGVGRFLPRARLLGVGKNGAPFLVQCNNGIYVTGELFHPHCFAHLLGMLS